MESWFLDGKNANSAKMVIDYFHIAIYIKGYF